MERCRGFRELWFLYTIGLQFIVFQPENILRSLAHLDTWALSL